MTFYPVVNNRYGISEGGRLSVSFPLRQSIRLSLRPVIVLELGLHGRRLELQALIIIVTG